MPKGINKSEDSSAVQLFLSDPDAITLSFGAFERIMLYGYRGFRNYSDAVALAVGAFGQVTFDECAHGEWGEGDREERNKKNPASLMRGANTYISTPATYSWY